MLWVCKQDGVHYSVDAPACPQCGGTEHWEQGAIPPAEPPPIDPRGDEQDDAGDQAGDQAGGSKPASRARGAK